MFLNVALKKICLCGEILTTFMVYKTESYKNPMQLWVSGSLSFQDSDSSAIKGISNQTNEDRRQQLRNFELVNN